MSCGGNKFWRLDRLWLQAIAQAESRSLAPPIRVPNFSRDLGSAQRFDFMSALGRKELGSFFSPVRNSMGRRLSACLCLSLPKARDLVICWSPRRLKLRSGFPDFGEYRVVFFVLFVAFASARPRINVSAFVATILAAIVAISLSAFWSAIKQDYREFVNKGSQEQVVLVPLEDRVEFFIDRVDNLDADTMARGFASMLRRISYVEFFGATLHFVPEGRPHENGTMTMAAISHIFLPRLLFPDKAPLPSDTTVTAAYTGLPITIRPGLSISIGYAGELYIDFGIIGMMAGMGILGFLYGKGSRFIQRHFDSALISYGATVALLMPGFYFETALPKIIGGVLTSFIILLAMSKFVLPFAMNALVWKEAGVSRSTNIGDRVVD